MKLPTRQVKQYFGDHGATILSIAAVGGVVGTAVLAVKATPKALQILELEYNDKGRDLTIPETIIAAGPCYIPALLCGMSTIVCILGANVLNQRKQAALNSAYILMANSYQEYRNKVKERFGKDIDAEIRKEMFEEHQEPSESDDAKILFYDEFSERYFNRTWKELLDAEYHLNKEFVMTSEIPINRFYDLLGLPGTRMGLDFGWSISAGMNFYGYEWIDFEHKFVKMEDGLECYIIDMPYPPTTDYLDL